jgi:imidazole glycerol phosphate synthase subunit HisF
MANKSKSNSPEVKSIEIETLVGEEDDMEIEIVEEVIEEVEIEITDSEVAEMTEDLEEILVINQKDVSIVEKMVTSPETVNNVIFILFSEKTKII